MYFSHTYYLFQSVTLITVYIIQCALFLFIVCLLLGYKLHEGRAFFPYFVYWHISLEPKTVPDTVGKHYVE